MRNKGYGKKRCSSEEIWRKEAIWRSRLRGKKGLGTKKEMNNSGEGRVQRELVDNDITLMMCLWKCRRVKEWMESWRNTVKGISHRAHCWLRWMIRQRSCMRRSMRRVGKEEVMGKSRGTFRLMSHHTQRKEKEKEKDGWMNNQR